MTGRDRIVVVGLVVLAVLGAGWMLLVSPERKQAAELESKVASARQELQSAQAQATSARSAQGRYVEAYKSIVSLGKAVPPLDEVPSLIYELDQASNQRNIEFNSISSGGAAAGTSGGGTAGSATAATPAAFTQMPFTFIFKGSFFGLDHLLSQIDGFAKVTAASEAAGSKGASTATVADIDGVQVSGRLLTIQSIDLTPESQGGAGAGLKSIKGTSSSGSDHHELTATISATAYVLPASQGLTGGATATGPVGSAAATAAASSGAANSPTTPAVIGATP
jgi:hypothetical protein